AGQRFGQRDLPRQCAQAPMAIIKHLLLGKERPQLDDRRTDHPIEGEIGRHGHRGKAEQYEQQHSERERISDAAPEIADFRPRSTEWTGSNSARQRLKKLLTLWHVKMLEKNLDRRQFVLPQFVPALMPGQ